LFIQENGNRARGCGVLIANACPGINGGKYVFLKFQGPGSRSTEKIMSEVHLETPDSVTESFGFGEVPSLAPAGPDEHFAAAAATVPAVPTLGPLKAFAGTFRGKGFNTIFRPNTGTPAKLPVQVTDDNLLELNLTEETLSFSPQLGSVPNRGEVQGDAFLNGVPYLQVVTDGTTPGSPVVIHVEPGLWMIVPATQDPHEGGTLVRMASIPHGTTIMAQGGTSLLKGPVNMQTAIPAIDITPFGTGSTDVPGNQVTFPNQNIADEKTVRIPQNLSSFVTAGTITAAMLKDPATFIRNHSQHQTVTSAVKISISTQPGKPLFGGGTSNIAFLLGDAQAATPNAQAVKMDATFWIETVEYTIQVPVTKAGQPPLVIPAQATAGGAPVPSFLVAPPAPVTAPRTIKATATQIQYAQQVFLNFNGLTWPHASVATLVPSAPVPVPASAFA
jgi:hypothetical protein